MRLLLATLAAALVATLGAGAATAAPAASAKLSPAEQKWAKPVVDLWNVMNTGLQNVVRQATADNGLVLGSAANKKLLAILVTFALCPETLAKAGKPPPRLAKVATTMRPACTNLDSGSKTFGQALAAIAKGNRTRGSTLVLQAINDFKKATPALAKARKQLLAAGGKSLFA
jgi:hypothetical protein